MTDEELTAVWQLQYRLQELTALNEDLLKERDRLQKANFDLALRLADLTPREREMAKR
jgi:type II secretory pathway component PulM